MNLQKDYEKCEQIIKEHSKSFYEAFSRLEDLNQRNAIYAVYAYCRHSDDIADEIASVDELKRLRAVLDDFVLHNKANDFIFRALADVREKFYPEDFDFKPYYDMLDGHLMDLNNYKYETLNDLLLYSKRVASSVGHMLIHILAPNGNLDKLKAVANDLGIAMQITNILRDIGEDFNNGRIYLPKDIMDKFGLTVDMIKNKEINDEFINTFNYLANISYDYYLKALNNLDAFPKNSRLILNYALVLYREIIQVCIDANYDVYNKKNYVSSFKKIKLIKEVNKNAK